MMDGNQMPGNPEGILNMIKATQSLGILNMIKATQSLTHTQPIT
jgi:hypothetical protein